MADKAARITIARRLERAEARNLGDVKSVGGSVYEMRIDLAPGYRLYYTMRGNELIIVLMGSDNRVILIKP